MSDMIGPDGKPTFFDGAGLRRWALAGLRFVLKLIVTAGLIGVVVGIVGYFGAVAFVDTYRSASSCASPADALTGETCRYLGQARVLSTSSVHGPEARIAFDSLPGRTFHVGWATVGAPDATLLKQGVTVDAELWDGVVTRFALAGMCQACLDLLAEDVAHVDLQRASRLAPTRRSTGTPLTWS